MNNAKTTRRALSTAVGSAAVLTALGLSACTGSPSSLQPTPSNSTSPAVGATPTPSASPTSATDNEAAAQALIDAPNARSFASSIDGRGNILTIWSAGYNYSKPTALAILDTKGRQVLTLGAPASHLVEALADGWLLRSNDGLMRLDSLGATEAVTKSAERSIAPRTGDIALGGYPYPSVYRPSTNTTYPLARLLRQVDGRGAAITSDGSLLTMVSRKGRVAAARHRSGRWSYQALDAGPGVAPDEIYGNGANIVATTTHHPEPLGDGEEDPLHRVIVSTDGGRNWHSARVPGTASVVLSTAVTASGIAFVSVGAPPSRNCYLLRISNAEKLSCISVPTIQVFAHDDTVYSTFHGRQGPYRFLSSDDAGNSWRPARVPGRPPN